MTSPRETNVYLTWISTLLRSGEKPSRLQWTADDRLVFAEILNPDTAEERIIFDVPVASLASAKVTSRWVTVVLNDGREFQVDLATGMHAEVFALTSRDEQNEYLAAHPLPDEQGWVEALTAAGVELTVTSSRKFYGYAVLGALGICVVVAVIVLLTQ